MNSSGRKPRASPLKAGLINPLLHFQNNNTNIVGQAPNAPLVSHANLTPSHDVRNPLDIIPAERTPPVSNTAANVDNANRSNVTGKICHCNKAIGYKCAYCAAWEPSEVGSAMPSMWSAATSKVTSTNESSEKSWMVGQRITNIKPDRIPSNTESKSTVVVVIGLKKVVPQEFWSGLEVRIFQQRNISSNDQEFVKRHETGRIGDRPSPAGSTTCSVLVKTLKPSGIRKGKRIAVKFNGDLSVGEYDVAVSFQGLTMHGSCPLDVRKTINFL
jgi:hypothetical protein